MRGKWQITLLSVGHGCVDVYQGAVAALVPFFIIERGYSYAAAAGVVLAASLLSSVAQPLFGMLTDWRPAPWLVPVSTLLSGSGIALSGVAGSYPLTLTCVAVAGLGVAAYHPESARLARLASGERHVAMSWFSLGGNVGFIVAPLVVAAVVATGGLAWSPLLVVPALAGAASSLVVLRTFDTTSRVAAGTAAGSGTDDVASFVKLVAAVVCRSIVFVGLSAFVSLYAEERVVGGTSAGTVALFVLYVGGGVGTLLGGKLAERWGRVVAARRAYLLGVAAVAGVVIVPGPAFYLFVALAALGLYVPFSLQVTLGQDYLPARVGTASGITLGLTVSAGGLVSPLIGAVADIASLQLALAPLIMMPIMCWLLFRTLPDPQVRRPPARHRDGASTEGHR